ncbi:DUF885 family protein [Fontimonas sp. SYSU GA230001]|uniref:DUF885 domain-containing protein n=1 Tax=Fontimonas sp. SYSU GA230001 TaxID=3142450 RepID=UPI0032B4D331
MKRILPVLIVTIFLGACATAAPPAAVAPAADVQKLFADYWEEYLQLYPLEATFAGDERYDDRLPNMLAPDFRAREHAFRRKWLERVQALDTAQLGDQDRLSVEIFLRDRTEALEGERFPEHLLPLNQFYSFANLAAQLGSGTSAQPFRTVAQHERWLRRAAQLPAIFDQAIANMREGMTRGIVQPRALMEKVVPQLDALVVDDPRQSLFWMPAANMPSDFAAADRERLSAAYLALIDERLTPAYRRLRDFVRDEYLPAARTSAGLDALPDGAAWYAYNVRRITTTGLTPAQIHQIGLDEVARIHAEMRRVIAALGFKGDLHDFFRFLATDPRFEFASEEALLAAYNGLRQRVDAGVPALFSVTPRAGFEIRPVEAFRARSAAGGEYQSPSEDGRRPGVFYVNTYDLPSRKTWDMEDLYLHEAIPGHHFQLAIQQELRGVPAFRRFGGYTAFIEGWALYTESLGKALGVYQDPYSYFGYLQNELWRAIRLVVDTGLHSRNWTREQVIEYMLANSAESETQSIAEAERYMAIPGQALAYKIGELKVKELRARAESQLGARFDIRAFHEEVLKDGAVPLDVLDAKITRWIAERQRG